MSNNYTPYLFRPLTIASATLRNRIVMAPQITSYASRDGFLSEKLYDYYVRSAHGGVGLIMTEPVQVVPPDPDIMRNHVGLYADAFVPRLRHLSESVQGGGARLIVVLDAPATAAQSDKRELTALGESFLQAAWRARQAGCDGVLLTATDGGVFQTLLSPVQSSPYDPTDSLLLERLLLPTEVIKGIRTWLGAQFLIGFRMVAETFSSGGLRLHHTQVIARHLSTAGINFFDIASDEHPEIPVARFPGWYIPLVQRIKRVVPDVPVIGSGLMGDLYLAESVVRDGSVDLVMLERARRVNPYWPQLAHIILVASRNKIYPEAQVLETHSNCA